MINNLKILKAFLVIFIICLVSLFNLIAQNQTNQQTAQTQSAADTKPLELPNFIIEGREQLNVQSGIKQFPEKVSFLSKSQLDSLNSLEKQQSLLLPQKQLPNSVLSFNRSEGYLKGAFGQYTTPSLEGAYNFAVQGYDLFAKGGFEHSQGNVDNSGYTNYYLNLNADYLADEKFFIFGGSKTKTKINLDSKNYNLYAISSAPERTSYLFNASIESDGSFESVDFLTGAAFKSLSLVQENASTSDNGIKGWIKLNKLTNNFGLGACITADFHSFGDKSLNSIDLFASGKYHLDNLLIYGDAGFQLAGNSYDETKSGVLIKAGLDFYSGKDLTFKANFSSRLSNSFYSDYFTINPYLSDSCNIDFGNITYFYAGLKYEPNQKFNFDLGFKYGVEERMPYFTKSGDSATFITNFDKASRLIITLETFWQIFDNDYLVFNLNFDKSSILNSKEIPFVPGTSFSAKYKRLWTERFGSELGILYIGDRYSDKVNKMILKGYYDLNLYSDYKIGKDFKIFAGFNNLLNNDVWVWSGYKERNLFFKLGLIWQF